MKSLALIKFLRYYLLAASLYTSLSIHAQSIHFPVEKNIALINADTNEIKQLINTAAALNDVHTDSAITILNQTQYWSEKNNYTPGIIHSLLQKVAGYAVKGDIESAQKHLYQAHEQCLSMKNVDNYLLHWNHGKFVLHLYEGQMDSALQALKSAQTLAEKIKDTTAIIRAYNHIGTVLINSSDYQKALGYINKAISINKFRSRELLVSYLNLAYIYDYLENTDSMYFFGKKPIC